MSQITIEKNPDPARLAELGVDGWPVWEKEVSEFPWEYIEEELSYILEGRAIITPEGGGPVEISKGDLVTFPAELLCIWKVVEPMRKHFHSP